MSIGLLSGITPPASFAATTTSPTANAASFRSVLLQAAANTSVAGSTVASTSSSSTESGLNLTGVDLSFDPSIPLTGPSDWQQSANALYEETTGNQAGSGPLSINIADVQAHADDLSAKLSSALNTLFANNNIPTQPPIKFGLLADGSTVGALPGPQADKVNAILNQLPDLRRIISHVGSLENMAQEGTEAGIFQQQSTAAYDSGGLSAYNAMESRWLSWASQTSTETLQFDGKTLTSLFNGQTQAQRESELTNYLG